MRSRMSSSTPGCEVRSSDSVQPVHSWNCSQMTDGFAPLSAALTKSSAASGPRPMAAAAIEQKRTKSRRETSPAPGVSRVNEANKGHLQDGDADLQSARSPGTRACEDATLGAATGVPARARRAGAVSHGFLEASFARFTSSGDFSAGRRRPLRCAHCGAGFPSVEPVDGFAEEWLLHSGSRTCAGRSARIELSDRIRSWKGIVAGSPGAGPRAGAGVHLFGRLSAGGSRLPLRLRRGRHLGRAERNPGEKLSAVRLAPDPRHAGPYGRTPADGADRPLSRSPAVHSIGHPAVLCGVRRRRVADAAADLHPDTRRHRRAIAFSPRHPEGVLA